MRILKLGALGALATACATACSSTPATAIAEPDAGVVTFDAGIIVDAGHPTIDAAPPPVHDAGPAAPTFTMVYNDIISPICVQCHNPNGIGVTMGHLDMSTQGAAFSNLVGVEAAGIACGGMGTRIVAGNANGSILFEKVNPGQPAPCGAKMPLGLTPLTTAQATEIENWINAGAKNN
jgi:hypothetical protein